MWIVYNITNYGEGVYFGGIYRSDELALKRWRWLCDNCEDDEDSWRIKFVPTKISKTNKTIV